MSDTQITKSNSTPLRWHNCRLCRLLLMGSLLIVAAIPSAIQWNRGRTALQPEMLATQVRAEQTPRSVTGQLNIEGQAIERVTLERKGATVAAGADNLVVLDHPGPNMRVPAGEYWVQGVELQSGFSCPQTRLIVGQAGEFRDGEWLTISPEKPCLLKIGGPLKPTVLAIREGRSVRFVYRLLDANGRMYVRQNAGSPPRFDVSCDGQTVGSGLFEYG